MLIGIDALSLIPGRTGGVETYIRNLVKAFGEIDTENHYIIYALPQAAEVLDFGASNIRIRKCNVPARGGLTVPARLMYEQLALPGVARRDGLDAMIFAANIGSLFFPCPSILIVYDLISMFYAQHYPGKMGYIKERVLPRMIGASARRADGVVAISKFTRDEVINQLNVPADRVEAVYPGVSGLLVSEEHGEPEGEDVRRVLQEPYILSVSYQHAHKNLDGLVHAFDVLKKSTDLPHKLVIAGKEESGTPALMQAIEESGRDDITVLGYVSLNNLRCLYSNASLFVFPSLTEGFGLVILEALAYALPVAASNAGPIPEVVGDAAVLFDPRNIEDMADAMRRCLTDSDLAADLRAKGPARAHDRNLFSWEASARGMIKVIEKVVSRTES